MKITIFWFRRDLRIEDNTALWNALSSGLPVMPIFIFDTNIIDELKQDDPRISFIYKNLAELDFIFKKFGSSLRILKSTPEIAFEKLLTEFDVHSVYSNRDYEPYAISRDSNFSKILNKLGLQFFQFKDHVIFEQDEILKGNDEPYTIFTPYKNQWLKKFSEQAYELKAVEPLLENLFSFRSEFPDLKELGFRISIIEVKNYQFDAIQNYAQLRDLPADDATTYMGPHLRFGTISIRQLINDIGNYSSVFLSELIWREFFMQILAHFPRVVNENFKTKYNNIQWLNNEHDFETWCKGETGYPMVDAGMKQLNQTGFMHNRVRMVVASFLCKHLLIDWRWGEAYFAQKLLDYELSSNNGNWQWAAGTGCDAAPYFRVFNPIAQQERFDQDFIYIRKWLKDFNTPQYPKPIVDHPMARQRAIEVYKKGLSIKI